MHNTNRVCTGIEKAILDKLFSHGYIGKKHTPIENVRKGFPPHMHGDVKKALKKTSPRRTNTRTYDILRH